MTNQATAQIPGHPERSAIRFPCLLLLLIQAGLTACAQPTTDPSGHAQQASAPAEKSVDAKGQQPVGYDVGELQRRLVAVLAKLESFDDVQPRSVQQALGVDLRPRAEQPLSLEGTGKLSNNWVFTVWAWQSEPDRAPWAPLQLFFYPGGDVDPKLWVDAPCFLETAGMLAELQAAGYAVIGERSNFPFHSVQLLRTTSKAEFTVRVGDYQILRGPLEGTRCLRDLTVTTGPAPSPR